MTAIPAAVAGLVAAWQAVADTTGVGVIDGPAYDPPEAFLAVGWDRSDQPGITATNDMIDAADARGLELFDVTCLLSISHDANSITEARAALFASFDVFRNALKADPRLGGAVIFARITAYEVTPILTDLGSVMDLRFTVQVQASN